MGNKSKSWRLEMVEILYHWRYTVGGLDASVAFPDLAPVYRAGRARA